MAIPFTLPIGVGQINGTSVAEDNPLIIGAELAVGIPQDKEPSLTGAIYFIE